MAQTVDDPVEFSEIQTRMDVPDMETRTAILIFQFAERIKSELIIASVLLEKMITLEGKERDGGEKMMTSFLEALIGEIRIAQGVEKSTNFLGAERKMMQAVEMIKRREYSGINPCISKALSLITTSCHQAMNVLMDRHLI